MNINLSLVFHKRNSAANCLKHAKEAVAIDENSSKAHYRLSLAHRLNNDLEPAKEHLGIAIKLEPGNKKLRAEYQELTQAKSQKERQWYSKMSGFLDSDRLKIMEQKERENEELKFKIHRQALRDDQIMDPN